MDAGYSGGGLYLANGVLQINSGLIRANHTEQSGGGIYVLNGVVAAAQAPASWTTRLWTVAASTPRARMCTSPTVASCPTATLA